MNTNDPNYQNSFDPENNEYNSTYLKPIVRLPEVPHPPPQQQNTGLAAATVTSGAYDRQQQQRVNVLFSSHTFFCLF